MNIYWSFFALETLSELHEFISQKSEVAADKYVDGIMESVNKLQKHPEACGACRNLKFKAVGYRCCKYKNHIIVYTIEQNQVNIRAVIHARRNLDQAFEALDL